MDELDFMPRLGRLRSGASPHAHTYLHLALAASAGGGMAKAAGRRFAGNRIGRDVTTALALRRARLIDQGFAREEGGILRIAPNPAAALERRELRRIAVRLAGDTGTNFIELTARTRIEGIVRRLPDLVSGRFAVIENSREFALVPWKPVLGRALGREASGVVRPRGGVSWSFTRERGIEV